MKNQPKIIQNDHENLPHLFAWVTSGRAETPENVAFRSGAVLMVLDQLVSNPTFGVPVKLLANRLALSSAAATSKLERRGARETDIRDAYHLTPPGAARGPDGDVLAFWRGSARLRLTGRDWRVGINGLIGSDFEDAIEGWLDAGTARAQSHGPLAGCVLVMRKVLEADDRAERVACLLSDIVVARMLGWPSPLPMTAQHLTSAMLRNLVSEAQGAELSVQRKILASIEGMIHLARELSSKAAALRAVAPKLRSKGSEAAVDLFLREDAVAPSTMLSPMIQGTGIPMTDRAARRFCDRLIELGVARELTGRSTFRLYGIAP